MMLKNPPSNSVRIQEHRASPATPLLSTIAVAAYLGIPVATIYAWRQKGSGPPGIKVGRHIKFRPEDVDEWLREHEDRAS
jgi:excisionase family DNA binding protein